MTNETLKAHLSEIFNYDVSVEGTESITVSDGVMDLSFERDTVIDWIENHGEDKWADFATLADG